MDAPQDDRSRPPSVHFRPGDKSTMPEAAAFGRSVFDAVREIPEGHVTTHEHIAFLIGHPSMARLVAVWLNRLEPKGEAAVLDGYDVSTVPWHRIVLDSGKLPTANRITEYPASRYPDGAAGQARTLRAEGVRVMDIRGSKLHVDIGEYGWFPAELPSRAALHWLEGALGSGL